MYCFAWLPRASHNYCFDGCGGCRCAACVCVCVCVCVQRGVGGKMSLLRLPRERSIIDSQTFYLTFRCMGVRGSVSDQEAQYCKLSYLIQLFIAQSSKVSITEFKLVWIWIMCRFSGGNYFNPEVFHMKFSFVKFTSNYMDIFCLLVNFK